MEDGQPPGVASDQMDLTAPNPAIPAVPAAPADDDAPVRPEQLSIRRRLLQPRTILSISVPLIIIAIFFWLNGDRLVEVPKLLLQADPRYVALAVGIFYLGFPLRGYRWKLLLRGTGVDVSTRDSTKIIFLSWLVDCIVPAKLGDVYRRTCSSSTATFRSAARSARSSSSGCSMSSRSRSSAWQPGSGAPERIAAGNPGRVPDRRHRRGVLAVGS